jgi:hypothetical protein
MAGTWPQRHQPNGREDLHLDLAGGSRRRTARAVFHGTHFPDEFPRAEDTKQDRGAVEFRDHRQSVMLSRSAGRREYRADAVLRRAWVREYSNPSHRKLNGIHDGASDLRLAKLKNFEPVGRVHNLLCESHDH